MLAEVTWHETTRVDTIAELDAVLDGIASQVSGEFPEDVDVTRANGDCLRVVLGAPGGCVLSFTAPSGDPPYWVSLGNPAATGSFAFFVQGCHHTETTLRHVILQADAWEAVRRFVQMTSGLPDNIEWEEV